MKKIIKSIPVMLLCMFSFGVLDALADRSGGECFLYEFELPGGTVVCGVACENDPEFYMMDCDADIFN